MQEQRADGVEEYHIHSVYQSEDWLCLASAGPRIWNRLQLINGIIFEDYPRGEMFEILHGRS